MTNTKTNEKTETATLASTWKGITVSEAKKTLEPITEAILKGFDDIATTRFDIGRMLAEVSDTGIFTAAHHSMAKRDWKPKGRRNDFSVYYQTVLGMETAEVGRLMDSYRVGAAEVELGIVEHGAQVTASHVRELAPALRAQGIKGMGKVIELAETAAETENRPVTADDLKTARKTVAPPKKRAKGGDTFAQSQVKAYRRHAKALAETVETLPPEALALLTAAEVQENADIQTGLVARVTTATDNAQSDDGLADVEVEQTA